jgi:hypothetical protein
MAERQLPKLIMWVRFPSPARRESPTWSDAVAGTWSSTGSPATSRWRRCPRVDGGARERRQRRSDRCPQATGVTTAALPLPLHSAPVALAVGRRASDPGLGAVNRHALDAGCARRRPPLGVPHRLNATVELHPADRAHRRVPQPPKPRPLPPSRSGFPQHPTYGPTVTTACGGDRTGRWSGRLDQRHDALDRDGAEDARVL